jgi:hypothetical protein
VLVARRASSKFQDVFQFEDAVGGEHAFAVDLKILGGILLPQHQLKRLRLVTNNMGTGLSIPP